MRVIHKKYMIGANNTSSIRLSGDISYHGNNETQAGAGMCQAQCKIRLFFFLSMIRSLSTLIKYRILIFPICLHIHFGAMVLLVW